MSIGQQPEYVIASHKMYLSDLISYQVLICYNNDGLVDYAVYDPCEDTLYFNDGRSATITEEFRAGATYELTDEAKEIIESLIENEDFDLPSGIENLSIGDY